MFYTCFFVIFNNCPILTKKCFAKRTTKNNGSMFDNEEKIMEGSRKEKGAFG